MFTPEQEKYLANLADKGLAEESEAVQREVDIEAAAKAKVDVDIKLAEVKTQVQAIVDANLDGFQVVITPNN